MARGDRDMFDYFLARELGVPLHEVQGWPNRDVMEWAAYYRLEGERQAHAQMRQRARRR